MKLCIASTRNAKWYASTQDGASDLYSLREVDRSVTRGAHCEHDGPVAGLTRLVVSGLYDDPSCQVIVEDEAVSADHFHLEDGRTIVGAG